VSWFRRSAVAEVEPETDESRMKAAEQERDHATAAYRAACGSSPNPRHPFGYQTGRTIYIQTPKGDAVERAADHAVREACERFHAACRQFAMLKFPKLIL
jgi:hypothetical protein